MGLRRWIDSQFPAVGRSLRLQQVFLAQAKNRGFHLPRAKQKFPILGKINPLPTAKPIKKDDRVCSLRRKSSCNDE